MPACSRPAAATSRIVAASRCVRHAVQRPAGGSAQCQGTRVYSEPAGLPAAAAHATTTRLCSHVPVIHGVMVMNQHWNCDECKLLKDGSLRAVAAGVFRGLDQLGALCSRSSGCERWRLYNTMRRPQGKQKPSACCDQIICPQQPGSL